MNATATLRRIVSDRPDAQKIHHAMGTVMTHRVYGTQADKSLEAVCREITRIEKLFSRFSPDSEIHRINRSAGMGCEKVSTETYAVLEQAAQFSRRSSGCFDSTIAPLVALWNSTRESRSLPEKSKIEQVLPLVNYRDVILDPWEITAGLRHTGQSIDLGGIGKGFAGDRIRQIFEEHGITSAYSNLGGNVVTLGAKPDGSPWLVGIQHPRKMDTLVGTVAVRNQSVVTSGDYQRYVTGSRGIRYHHILDPSTGYPSKSGLISVSIVSESALAADALSTAVFVAGMERGKALLQRFPRTEAVLVDSELRVYLSQGLIPRFQTDRVMDITIID